MTARNIARTRMNTSAMRNIFTFTRNARAIAGNDSLNCSPLKNASLTSSHPGALMTATTSTVKNTTVLSDRDPHGSFALRPAATRAAEDPGAPAAGVVEERVDLVSVSRRRSRRRHPSATG